MNEFDIFGNPVKKKYKLTDTFIANPFSIIKSYGGDWNKRKNKWLSMGIKSELGRSTKGNNQYQSLDRKKMSESVKKISEIGKTASIFDPALCEVLYHWFCPKYSNILDCFAGGSVRGIVANYLGYKYTGIELRQEQVLANIEQGKNILHENCPEWICGDSNKVLDRMNMEQKFDFLFSCPPYYNLEVYSDESGDLSNMDYEEFENAYESIIRKSCEKLNNNRFACFVVGNCRDKQGFMKDLVGLTIRAFEKSGLRFYNDIILEQVIASGAMRAKNTMKHRKVVKIHQNILVFCKGNPKIYSDETKGELI